MGMPDSVAQYRADRHREVKIDTWGHLAPREGTKYPLRLVVAVPYFDSLNPVVLRCEVTEEADYGPWFYDSVHDFISEKVGDDKNSGKLYEFKGHWRNYKFVGKFRELKEVL